MSIDKWLNEKDSKEERIRREKAFKSLSKQEVQDLKTKKIRDMVQKDDQKTNKVSERDKFLDNILEFKNWLNQRTYLKGDIAKIETWIKNLYSIVNYEPELKVKLANYSEKRKFIEKYKEIPPKFLDEKTRVALNKLIHGTTRTNSDNYYLRKLKNILKEKLKEAEYFEILDRLFRIF
ncbi:MAG: hypothetical protein KAT57_02555 [Candidatus Lokiarchaeota archaeon]|nr:hypothetical protein [Candidatus Lokiarchaeota archaeon]